MEFKNSHLLLLNSYLARIGIFIDTTIPATLANIDVNVEATKINDGSLSEVRGNIRDEKKNLDDENDSWT